MGKIEKYYLDKDGDTQVTMKADVAKEIQIAIKAFSAGKQSECPSMGRELATARYIANEFLEDSTSKRFACFDYITFLNTVEKKIKELIK